MIFFRTIQRPKAMSFDLDDTLYNNQPHMLRAEKSLMQFIAQTAPEAAEKDRGFWLKHKRALLKLNPNLQSDMGELRKLTLTQGFRELGYTGQSLSELVSACFDYFYYERSNFEVESNIKQVLEKLAGSIPLVAITNGNVNLSQIGINDYFEVCFKASLTSPMKPDGYMFQKTSEYLNLSPSQILHVGDNFEKDIFGAIRAGFKSAWHACNRPMNITKEDTMVLPDLVINNLGELEELI